MTGFLDKLNLRPSEKRLVVVIAAVFFVVLNFWFVVPHRNDWSKVQDRMWQANRKLQTYEKEIRQLPTYKKLIAELQSEGAQVDAEDQRLHFANTILSQAAQTGVTVLQTGRQETQTNQFFLEQKQTVNIQGGEQQIVSFLYNLGSANSLIRVRELTLQPENPRYRLSAGVTLVASYQKKLPTRPGAASSGARADASGKANKSPN